MAAPALILGAQESCQWVPGTGETRQVAGRVHIMEHLSLWKQSDPPHAGPSLTYPTAPL